MEHFKQGQVFFSDNWSALSWKRAEAVHILLHQKGTSPTTPPLEIRVAEIGGYVAIANHSFKLIFGKIIYEKINGEKLVLHLCP